MYTCKNCGKTFSKKGSLTNHMKWCGKKKEINHICPKCGKYIHNHIEQHIEVCGNKKEKLSKEEIAIANKKRWEDPVFKNRVLTAMKNAGGLTGKAKTPDAEIERKEKISATLKKNPNAGGYRQGSGRGKGCWYESKIAGTVYLDSTWELAYAKYLDDHNINWERNTKRFEYKDDNKIKKYIPDFYLVETDEYIEIKGFDRRNDKLKWEYFPYKLTILREKELKEMGIV